MNSRRCSPAADRTFGPLVNGCRADFDFTFLFQESILSITPSSIFLLAAFIRIKYLCKQAVKAEGWRPLAAKLVDGCSSI